MNRPDELLWISQAALLNDKRAFGKLMHRYHTRVRRYFLMMSSGDRDLSDDLAQITFIRAWQGIDGFRMLSSFSTWLYRIAYTTWCNHAASVKNSLSLDDSLAIAEVESMCSDPPPDDDRAVMLNRAIAMLNEPERNCITLFYLEELTIRDIQKITGYKQGTIKSHLSRGREHLRMVLKKYDSDET